MDEGNDILDDINKVKSLADQFTCLELPMKEDDVIMTLLDCLPPWFDHLVIVLEMFLMKEFMLDFITQVTCTKSPRRRRKSLKEVIIWP